MNLRPYIWPLAALLCGCLGKVSTDDEFRRQIVVEGRIEPERGAEVTLTLNLPYAGTLTEEMLSDAVIHWAKVTLRCEGESEVLTGYNSDRYMTRFVYRSNRLIGQAGKAYTLTVEYSGRTLTAETSIPQPRDLDALECVAIDEERYTIRARFTDPAEKNAYLFECLTPDANYFRPALLGIVDDSLFPDGQADVTINRPLDYIHIKDYNQYFRRDEEVIVRFNTVGAFGYDYWSLFENEVLNALNPIFPSDNALPTNIRGDGRGIWCGYGSRYYRAAYPEP